MKTIMRSLFLCLCMLLSTTAVYAQQDAKALYKEGKELYDAGKYNKAVPKLKAAAELGNKKAQYRLGRCYDKGYGVTENNKKAVELYAKSAAQGYDKAQYRLGQCYEKGKVVKKDMKQARYWYEKAAAQGYDKAIEALKK